MCQHVLCKCHSKSVHSTYITSSQRLHCPQHLHHIKSATPLSLLRSIVPPPLHCPSSAPSQHALFITSTTLPLLYPAILPLSQSLPLLFHTKLVSTSHLLPQLLHLLSSLCQGAVAQLVTDLNFPRDPLPCSLPHARKSAGFCLVA